MNSLFLNVLTKENKKLIETAFQLHQEGKIAPDSYIIDVDMLLNNAEKILEKAKKHRIKLYYMTKQIGRNPYLADKMEKMGYEGAVAVDFKEVEILMKNRLKIGHVGHLVQIPKNSLEKLIMYGVEIITVYSLEKAEEISKICQKLNITQKIMLRVVDEDSCIYPGQESGFELKNLNKNIEKLLMLKGIKIDGLTSFPCFLYNNKDKKIRKTSNVKTVLKARDILEEKFKIHVSQINMPSITSIENMELIGKAGGTHGEPGHSLTGTIPMAVDTEIEEKPAYVYVSEVSHNFRGKGYFYGGGYYRRSHFKNILTGKNFKDSIKKEINIPDSDSIDYYFEIEDEGKVGDTVVGCFRTQIFVTRSDVILVKGIQKNDPKIIGVYTSLGERLDIRQSKAQAEHNRRSLK